MPSQNDIRRSITNQIISALESGNVPPWRRPWRFGENAGAAANVVSKRSYRGLNPILLDLASQTHGFSSRWWATYRQWRQMGGRVMSRPSHVPPGKWGTQIVYWSPITKKVENESGDLEDDRFFVLRLYTVFNVDQVEGSHLDHLRAGQPDTGETLVIDYQPAEDAIEATGACIRYGGGKAFYSPTGDFIQCPPRTTFTEPDEFYETILHELCH
jgi:antirestriction protein ArdC